MVATRNITSLNALTTPQADDLLLIIDRLSSTSTEAKSITWANVQEAIQDIVGALAVDTTSINFTYDDANGQLTAAVIDNTSTQKSIYSENGTQQSTRQEANLIEGTGININVVDNSGDDRADITVINQGLVTATNNSVSGTSEALSNSITTASDGSKTLNLRALKAGSTQLTITSTDSGQSITFDIDPSQIDINSLDTTNPLAISVGGTGANSAAVARNNLGAAKLGSNSDISSLSGLTTPLSVSQGGTGANTADGALANLQGLNNVAGVGAIGEQVVYQGAALVSGVYRAEFKGIKPTSTNYITVATDGSDIALGANPNNIFDGISGLRTANGARISNVGAPINQNDVASKAYVDAQTTGLDLKASVVVATTGNLAATYNNTAQTLTANSNGAIAIDGVTLNLNDRVLVKDQTTQTENGIYTATTLGDGSTAFVLTRADDFNTSAEADAGAHTYVEAGTVNTGKSFVQTTRNVTLDASNIVFSVFGDVAIGTNSIANNKLEQVGEATFKGRIAGGGTGDVTDMTADQAISALNAATSSTINAARLSMPASADTNARVQVFKNSDSSPTGTRRAVRFIEGANTTITINDDASNEEVEVTIQANVSAAGVSLGLAIALG